MRRKVTLFFIICICFLLQTTVFKALTFANISPNLLIIAVSSFGFMRGKKEGMAVGFISGIFIDVFWGNSLGFNMLLYTVIGYMNGAFQRLFYDDDIKLPIGLIAASELIYGVVSCFCI